MMTIDNQATTVDRIKADHRRRRYAIKIQAKLDRAIESFVRINATAWRWDAPEEEREKYNKEVEAIIAKALKGKGNATIVELVALTDKARFPFDSVREAAEKNMEKLAKTLPVADWIKGIRGAGLPGLATIVGEAGDLSNYVSSTGAPAPAKLWKRLGFAPYDGLAGSTWKREKWRPRALSKDEWIANPFSGQRYAFIHQNAVWLKNAQWIGAKKTDDGVGKPKGHYGEIYAKRRAHTEKVHPDWTKQHYHMDGLRVMMKAFLKDLLIEWHRVAALEQQLGEELEQQAQQKPQKQPKVPLPVAAAQRTKERLRRESRAE